MSESTGIEALKRAIKVLGSQGATAAAIGTKQQYISDKLKAGKPIPAEWCIPLDLATQDKGERISCHQLRSDLWPETFNPKVDMAA